MLLFQLKMAGRSEVKFPIIDGGNSMADIRVLGSDVLWCGDLLDTACNCAGCCWELRGALLLLLVAVTVVGCS